jgi:hypothetical protein
MEFCVPRGGLPFTWGLTSRLGRVTLRGVDTWAESQLPMNERLAQDDFRPLTWPEPGWSFAVPRAPVTEAWSGRRWGFVRPLAALAPIEKGGPGCLRAVPVLKEVRPPG